MPVTTHAWRAFGILLLVFSGALWVHPGGMLTAADPAWFNQPQFFAYFSGYVFSVDPLIYQIPYTGQAWGIHLPNTGTNDYLKSEIAIWKHRNATTPYFCSTNGSAVWGVPLPPEWDAFRMRTLDGQYWDQYGMPIYSISSPVFQAFLKQQAQRAVDIGCDGILLDAPETQFTTAIYNPPHNAGSFDSVTLAAFRNWLQQKYSSAVLQSQYGIVDISNFNFGDWIRTNNLSDKWNSRPLTGLPLEFFLFRRQELIGFLRDLVSSTKAYALQQYNRDFLFTSNPYFDELAYLERDMMDLSTNEAGYIRSTMRTTHPFMAQHIKSWKGWRSPILVLPEAFPPSINVPNPLTKATANLMRVIIADIQAAGGMPGATTQMNVGLGTPEPVDLSVVHRYADFILNSPQMVHTSTPSRIALVESAPSVVGRLFLTPAEANPDNGPTAYTGTARLLLDGGFTYDSVFFPDTTYSTLPSPSGQSLSRYQAVLAPSVWALDDNQVNALLAYANAGGTLIVVGSFATSRPDGSAASRPQLAGALPRSGAAAYGAGRIVVSQELFGVEYQNADNGTQRQARAAFERFLSQYVESDVQVNGVTAVIHEPGITPFFYLDANRQPLVHLVNYDYDDATDQFFPKTNFTLNVRVGSVVVDDVVLRSPDSPFAQTVPFLRNGNTITLTIPRVDAWVVLSFQQNKFAPVISVSAPTHDFGAVGGSTLNFSVQAQDPDQNALTYTWSVNGQPDNDAFGPSYSVQLPVNASGIYTVTVTISDGSHTTQRSWSINVAAYCPPRVLFDETHTEYNTIDATRASQLNPDHPDWVLFGILAKAMGPGYRVSRLASGAITPEVLAGTDVLVLAAPRNTLNAAESQAITYFVQAGGALIFLGDVGLNTAINTLLGQWGIQFDRTMIESQQTTCCPGNFYLNSFANHPAVAPDAGFYTNNGGSFTVSQGAIPLGFTSSAEWKSTSGQATQQPGEPNGPFVMVAATQAGNGRVFVVSDNAFHDGYLQQSSFFGNLSLFLSALAWLSAPVNPAPPVPSTTNPAISSVVNAASFTAGVAPGGWATIFGQNLSNTPASGLGWSSGDFNGVFLPTSLAGTSVRVDGRAAAVAFVSPTQLNIQVPDYTSYGTVSVQVDGPYGRATSTANIQSFAPAIFPAAAGNATYAAAVGVDGRPIALPDQIPGARLARPGEILQVFGTGFGETVVHRPAGQLVNATPLANTVTATICGQIARVSYAGLVGAGLNQINVTVPVLPPGTCTVQFAVAGTASQDGIVLPIGQ
jgi:uncharacterized protein (TIGR03437 family)